MAIRPRVRAIARNPRARARVFTRLGPCWPPEAASSGLLAEDVLRLQEAVHRVTVEEALVDYMLAIVEKTRNHESLALGVSPRG